MKYLYLYKNNICKLGIAEENNAICNILFIRTEKGNEKLPDGFEKAQTPLLLKAAKQLDEYFNGKRKEFDLPLAPRGTEFQNKVWKALQAIPFGKTCSYGQLAAMTGNPKACRAVGMANNRNPIPVIIPCHRVIGHNGALTGYAGGLELKQKLLELESCGLYKKR